MKLSRSARTNIRGEQALRRTLRGLGWFCLVCAAVVLVAVLLRPVYLQRAAALVERHWGAQLQAYDRTLADQWSVAVGDYLRATLPGLPDIPSLVIDVPFREMSKIYAKREDALERGILVQGDDDFVTGTIRYESRAIPVKLRLKGDWNDHLMGRKWSFRFRVRGGDELFGMRRFSIQNPNTRGYQAELLYFELLRQFGVMVPRYQFVNVTLNGDSMGLMALEEFFAKEMLEYNRRREGVIVRFNESLVWDAKDALSGEDNGWDGVFDHYSNAPVDSIGSSQIAASAVLSQQYQVAEGLLRGFVEQKLPASAVFDVPLLAAFIAVSDSLGAWHAVAWHNMRFYLNPLTLRLEPIAFDATLQDRTEGNDSVINAEPLLVRMLSDPLVWQAYQDVLRQLADSNSDGATEQRLRKYEEPLLQILQTEFRLLGRYPLDYLQPRLQALLARTQADIGSGAVAEMPAINYADDYDEYPVLAHLGVLQTPDGPQLQADTAVPRDVQLRAVEWIDTGSGQRQSAVADGVLPLALPARSLGELFTRRTLELLPAPAGDDWVLEVAVGFADRGWAKNFRPGPVFPALTATPVPRGDVAEQLQLHSFLKLDADSRQFSIAAGQWELQQPLIIPRGYSLQLAAGAVLNFAPTVTLVSHGPVHFAGTAAAPVVLQPSGDGSWPGMIVTEAAGVSRLEHVRVRGTSGLSMGMWSSTGGVSFYASDVEISDTELFDSRGEDALNIIHSHFSIRDSLIDGTASDAFDADFATGEVSGSRFVRIGLAGGGDAIDISGSEISVSNCEFQDISDKALSVGERSTMQASGIRIESTGTGAASKDGSVLQLSDAGIRNAYFAGLTAYIKKPEYGPAEIVADNVRIEITETPVLVQIGSRVQVDGQAIATRDIDVDELYATVMRKGAR